MELDLTDEEIIELEGVANYIVEEESEFGWFCHGFCTALRTIFSKGAFPGRHLIPQREAIKWVAKLLMLKDEVMTSAAMYLMDESSGIKAHRRRAMALRRLVEEQVRKGEKKGEQNGE